MQGLLALALVGLLATPVSAAEVHPHMTWAGWKELPGGLRTIAAPAAKTYSGKLYVFAISEDRKVLYNVFEGGSWDTGWSGWQEVPGDATTDTHVGLAILSAGGLGNLVVVRKTLDRHIWFNRFDSSGNWAGWTEVPGNGTTDAAVTAFNFRGVRLFSKGINDSRIYTNGFDGNEWEGWSAVPGDGTTNAALGPATFAPSGPGQHPALHLFSKGINVPRIFENVQQSTGDWRGWSEVPGEGTTDAPLAPVLFGDHLLLFSKGINDRQIYLNATDGQNWAGWAPLPGGGTTDASVAPAPFPTVCHKLYLFSKGIDDKRIYVNIGSFDANHVPRACRG